MLGNMQLSMVPIFRWVTLALSVVYLLVLSVMYSRVKKEIHTVDIEEARLFILQPAHRQLNKLSAMRSAVKNEQSQIKETLDELIAKTAL